MNATPSSRVKSSTLLSSARWFAVAAFALSSLSAMAQQSQRYFGYFASGGYATEVKSHANVTVIWAAYTNRNTATQTILTELALAKANNLKAIVPAESFLFKSGSATVVASPFTIEPDSVAVWNTLVTALVNGQYLVPGNPAASTVLAFYPVDEPELHGLNDSSGQAHPALANAVATIRNNPASAGFPIVMTASKQYASAINGLKLANWVGMENYQLSSTAYLSAFITFESQLSANQRSIFVPQAATGGFMAPYGAVHDPDAIFDAFHNDAKTIMLMPFLWGHAQATGVRGIPSLKNSYTAIGTHIKTNGPLPLLLNASCIGSGGIFECEATASRGTGPYSYAWSNGHTSTSGVTTYFAPCGFNQTISVVATDSVGTKRTYAFDIFCAKGSLPL